MTKYTYEQRMKAVLEVIERHVSYSAVGKMLGCRDAPMHCWIKQYAKFAEACRYFKEYILLPT